jgi:hypothetical protein
MQHCGRSEMRAKSKTIVNRQDLCWRCNLCNNLDILKLGRNLGNNDLKNQNNLKLRNRNCLRGTTKALESAMIKKEGKG